MKKKISNQFAANYLIVFILSILAALFALALMSFAGDVLSKTLAKNIYPAETLMKNDYTQIDASPVVESGGGVQVVDETYSVVYSKGLDTIGQTQLTAGEFTEFLVQSRSIGLAYHYDILYNEEGRFWLIITFPTSVRIDFAVAYNAAYASRDMQHVAGALIAIVIFYLLLLAIFAFIFSRITAAGFTRPLGRLADGARRLKEGDYAARIDLKLKNEFAELQETFNEMAARIELETARRRESEDERKRLVLDISHDLKNPLASAAGYAELLLNRPGLAPEEREGYLKIIHNSSLRAGKLLGDLFELSKLDSPDFRLCLEKTDIAEFLRQICAGLLPAFDDAGFTSVFDIPDRPVLVMMDAAQLGRVFYNLADNAIRYNPAGTEITVRLWVKAGNAAILFKDNGVGIPADKARDIFKPFVRGDEARNSKTGGSGLGLSIAQKIVLGLGGTLSLAQDGTPESDINGGSAFLISLPTV